MSLLRVNASIRKDGSVSREIADLVERSWREDNPGATIVRRELGLDPIPSDAWAQAVVGSHVTPHQRDDAQRRAVALASTVADEVIDADVVILAVPLYNFGVSQHVKTWIDLLFTDPRLATAAAPEHLGGKPVELVIVRGGGYGEGTPREGWDHSTGWIRRILEDVWKVDLRIVETELTLVGVNPALDEFKDLARQMRQEAEALALVHGHHLTAVHAN